MKTVLKWIGIVIGALVALIVVAFVAILVISSVRLNRTYSVPDEGVVVPADAAAVARGEYLVGTVGGCKDCHGPDLSGGPFIDDPSIGKVFSRNLTSGQGGAGAAFSDADWVRAIRHGVRPNGQGMIVMPSTDFYGLSDADLGAIIAYVKSVPPVDNVTPDPQFTPLARVLFVMGAFPPPAASLIDHTAPRPADVPPGVTPEYGKYLASVGCVGCHQPDLAGGPIPGAPPGFPPSANLTPGGELAAWSEADFLNTIRTGVTPSGHELPGEAMPWPNFSKLTDDDLKAIWAYLQTVPAKETAAQ